MIDLSRDARVRSGHRAVSRRAVAWMSVVTLCATYAGGLVSASAAGAASVHSAAAAKPATTVHTLTPTLIHAHLAKRPRHHRKVNPAHTAAARQARRAATLAKRRAAHAKSSGHAAASRTSAKTNSSAVTSAAFGSSDQNFDGLDDNFNDSDPLNFGDDFQPDPSIDVSPQYVVQAASPSLGVFSKSGAFLGGTELEDFFSNDGTTNTGTACDYDVDDSLLSSGQVLYDTQHARWVVAAEEDADVDAGPFYECIAVSTTSDPLGAYNLYAVQLEPGGDVYPSSQAFGLWSDGLYMAMDRACSEDDESLCPIGTVTASASNTDLEGDLSPQLFAFNITDLEAGTGVRWQTTSGTPNAFNGSGGTFDAANEFQLIPATQEAMTGLPAAGTPEYFMSADDSNVRIDNWQWNVNWNAPGSSTLSARSQITVASSTFDADGLSDEPSPGNQIYNNFNDLLPRIRYTNFGGVESVWTAWSDEATSGCTNNGALNDTCTGRIHWFQLAVNSGTRALTIGTQNIYAPDTLVDRILPSLSVDKNNDMLVGYTVTQGRAAAATKVYPGLRWAGRLSTDTTGTTGQAESSVVAGTGYQIGSSDPSDVADTIFTSYGSFSSMTTDPDGCEFWYSGEYQKDQPATYAANTWYTRIAATHYASCTPTTLATAVSAVSGTGPVDGSAALTATLSATGTNSGIGGQTVTFSLNGTPVGTGVTDDNGVAKTASVSITGTPGGTASGIVSASYAGAGEYGGSSASGDLLATGATAQSISFDPIADHTFGDADFAVSATADSGNAVSFTASGSCTVFGSAVHITTGGSCAITATQAGDATYAPATPVTHTFAIARATQTITFTGVGTSVATAVAETATASSGLAVYLTSSTSTCQVVSPTVLSAAHAGTCTLVAHQDGNSSYAPVTLSQDVVIGAGVQTGSITAGGSTSGSRRFDQMATMGTTWTSGLATTSWSSVNTVATIAASPNGAKETGTTVTITTTAAHGFVAGEQVSVSGVPVAGYNGTFTILTVTSTAFTYTAASGLTATGGGSVVAVAPCASTSGASITVLHAGPCTITANQAGNADYGAATTTRAYTVTAGTQTITFAPTGSKPIIPDFVETVTVNSGLATGAITSTTTSVCTASPTSSPVTVHPLTTGTCTLSAAGNSGSVDWSARAATTANFTIAKVNQTITFGALPGATYGDPDFAVSATASSGNTVTFTPSGQCSMPDAVTVHITGAGSCTITASQAGDSNYNAATPVPQTFSIAMANQTITFSVADHTFGDPDFDVSATASSGLPVSFAIQTGNCSISGSTVHITGAGSCAVDASQAGDANNNAAPDVVRTFAISKASQSISFDPIADHTFGDPDFSASASASSGDAISWSAVGDCTVDGSGTVHITGGGSCSVTASQSGDSNYNPASDVTQPFSIGQASQSISFGPITDHTYGDPNFDVSATATSGLAVSFGASGDCTVTGTTVSITGAGSCTITASQPGDADYSAAADVPQSFDIEQVSQSISFGALTDHTYGDPSFDVSATATSGLAVSFTAAGSCSVTGVTVSITDVGDCTVTAHQAGDANTAAASDVPQTFSVAKADQSIDFSVADHNVGDPDFDVSATATSGLAVSFSIDSGDCTITGATVHITGEGFCTVIASQAGDSHYNAAPDVVRTFQITRKSQTITFAPLVHHTYGDADFDLSATSSSGLTVTYAAVGDCTVTGVSVHITGAGSCVITASQTGDTDYNPASDVHRTLVIEQVTQSITFASISNHTFGDPNVALGATSSAGLPVTYSRTGPCNIVGGTSVHLTAAGTCTITAHQVGNANTKKASNVVRVFSISAAATTLTLTITPKNVAQGNSITLKGRVKSTGLHPTGTVEFFLDGVSIGSAPAGSNGLATLVYAVTQAPAHYTATGTYSDGQSRYQGSSSNPITIRVHAA